ncbi:hypothetical protein [Maribacter dokdonensis]|uniref:hypothetical protein n=1 Tax=Maribacter dokdonensis TaxID=320912 RepID=UPI001C09D47E|nr:hypothetical protein [Maribacter dokdonensis]MBU2902978.1 hypothetical protein [Maribacter dokdonensis]
MVRIILVNIHVIAAIVWVGAVFMGAFVDWPAIKESMKNKQFPYEFIIGQGKRVFISVYTAITLLWTTGLALVVLQPPNNSTGIILLIIKTLSLLLMTLFTLHGTLSSWPKLQTSTDSEAFKIYEFYIKKAYGTFVFGIIASLSGLMLRQLFTF